MVIDGYIYIYIYIISNHISYAMCISYYIILSGADVRPKFHWGLSYNVICSGYISNCFRVCLGLV